jgi:hypothetical protein
VSVESIAIALHHSRAKGTAKLVLIGIANHDGDGGAWPSIATLAKYAGVSARNTQKAVDQLVALGEIRREVQKGGDLRVPDHRRPNLYRFLLGCPHNCDRTKNHRTRQHELSEFVPVPEGVSVATPGVGSDRGGVSVATPKPSSNPTTSDDHLERQVVNAREEDHPIANACPRWRGSVPHTFVKGKCIDCFEEEPS